MPSGGAITHSSAEAQAALRVNPDFELKGSGMKMGGGPKQFGIDAETVPEVLALPWLRPFYDEPEFVVRNIWRTYGGWWDGNPAHLLPPRQAALRRQARPPRRSRPRSVHAAAASPASAGRRRRLRSPSYCSNTVPIRMLKTRASAKRQYTWQRFTTERMWLDC